MILHHLNPACTTIFVSPKHFFIAYKERVMKTDLNLSCRLAPMYVMLG